MKLRDQDKMIPRSGFHRRVGLPLVSESRPPCSSRLSLRHIYQMKRPRLLQAVRDGVDDRAVMAEAPAVDEFMAQQGCGFAGGAERRAQI